MGVSLYGLDSSHYGAKTDRDARASRVSQGALIFFLVATQISQRGGARFLGKSRAAASKAAIRALAARS
jgi:hypothetical protein